LFATIADKNRELLKGYNECWHFASFVAFTKGHQFVLGITTKTSSHWSSTNTTTSIFRQGCIDGRTIDHEVIFLSLLSYLQRSSMSWPC